MCPLSRAESQPYTLPLFKQEKTRWLAFDLEITRVLPADAGELKCYRPLGISCAATLSSAGELNMWVERDAHGQYLPRLSTSTAAELARFLSERNTNGWRIVTWNGLGFDFDILYEESGWLTLCKDLASDHVDMMFHVFCEKGYPLSLEKAARGMGLAGKLEGMNGALAPLMWQRGEHEIVLQYLEQDVRLTLELALAAQGEGALRWVSASGYLQELKLPRGWLLVKEALNLPLPDTAWMDKPWPREKFSGWLDS